MGIDPRKGLRPNLDLLSAYKIYEKDYPLFKPDISATLAMNSPLYKRIEEGLTEQSQLKAEHDADHARMRNAAVTANVPLEPLREMMTALIRETQPPAPATAAASSTLTTHTCKLIVHKGNDCLLNSNRLQPINKTLSGTRLSQHLSPSV